MDVLVKLITDDIRADEDEKTSSLSVEVNIFDQLYLKDRPISFPVSQISTIKQKYDK